MNFDHLFLRPRSPSASLRLTQRELALLGLPLVVGTTSEGEQCFGGVARYADETTVIAARHAEGYRLRIWPTPSAELRHEIFGISGERGLDDGCSTEWLIDDRRDLPLIGNALNFRLGPVAPITSLNEGLRFRLTDALGDTRKLGFLHYGMKFDLDYKPARTFGSNFCKMCGEPMQDKVVEQPDVTRRACTSCDYIDWDPPMVVSVVIVRDKERKGVWLIRRSNTQVGKIAFAGGFLMRHEGIFLGGKRESWEETGFVVVIDGFLWETPVPGKNEILAFLLGTVESGTPTPSSETSEVMFLTNEELATQALAYPLHDQAKAMYLATLAG
jgi:ADP-ribose pyrophosphatase YjhB (NUDIX family)